MDKLTEDQTILLLIDHLKNSGWEILSYCLGQQRGYDIVAINSAAQEFQGFVPLVRQRTVLSKDFI